MVDRAVKHRPDRPVVVMTESSPNGFLRTGVRGRSRRRDHASAFAERGRVHAPEGDRSPQGPRRPGKPTAPLIAVLGPKGGTGKTLVSTNLAVALAQRDANVVLVDLDLQFGDIGLALGLSPERTMYDLMKAGAPFDHEKLDRHLIQHSSGVKVLIAPTRPDQASAVSVDFLRDIYASLRTMCDAVIVDTPPGFTPEVIATIDVSSDICMVGMLDSLSLKNTKLGLETLDLMGYETDARLARPQPRGLARRDHAGGRLDDHRPQPRTSPSRATARSRARSTRGRRSSRSKPQSGAAKAFRSLADRYAKTPASTPAPLPSSSSGGVRRLLAGGSADGTPRAPQHREAARRRADDPFAEVKSRVHFTVIGDLGPQLYNVNMDPEALRERVLADVRDQLAQETGISRDDRQRIALEITDDILGHGPLERLLADESVTEIMVNGPHDIWIERGGRLYQSDVQFNDESHLRRIINKMVAQVGRRIDESSPMVDARLPDGSRVNAVIPPLSLSGPLITIRKFSRKPADARRHDQARHAQPGDGRVPRSAASGPS